MAAETTLHERPEPSDEEKKIRLRAIAADLRNFRRYWIVVGRLLWEVLRDRLYLLEAATFDQYLLGHGFKPRTGRDLVAGARIAKRIKDVPHELSLRAALQLAPLPDDLTAKCLAEVIQQTGTESPTAKQVAEIVARWPRRADANHKPRKKPKARPKPWRQRFAGGEIVVRLKAGVDLRALLLEAIARIDAQKVA